MPLDGYWLSFQVGPLGWEDALEKGTATHSSILAGRIPWTGAPDSVESDTTEQLTLSLSSQPGESLGD